MKQADRDEGKSPEGLSTDEREELRRLRAHVVYPQVWSTYEHVLTGGHVIVRGKLQIEGNWRGLSVEEARRLDGIFGGYEGHPSASGGRDRWVQKPVASNVSTT